MQVFIGFPASNPVPMGCHSTSTLELSLSTARGSGGVDNPPKASTGHEPPRIGCGFSASGIDLIWRIVELYAYHDPPLRADTHLGRTNPRTQFNAHFSRPPLLVDSSTASVWTGIVRESDFRPHALEPLRQATTLHDSRRLTPPVLFQSRCLFIPAIATSGATREQTV